MSALLIWGTLIILDPIITDRASTYGHCVHALSQSHLTFLCVELFMLNASSLTSDFNPLGKMFLFLFLITDRCLFIFKRNTLYVLDSADSGLQNN